MRVDQIMALGNVQRWHMVSPLHAQNVAAHSFGVAMLARHIAPGDLHVIERVQLLELGLVHDAHETRFGDIPGPAKHEMMEHKIDIDGWCRKSFWKVDPYDLVTDRVRHLVEVADRLEEAMFAHLNLPELAEQMALQTIRTARTSLTDESVERVVEALSPIPRK